VADCRSDQKRRIARARGAALTKCEYGLRSITPHGELILLPWSREVCPKDVLAGHRLVSDVACRVQQVCRTEQNKMRNLKTMKTERRNF